MEIYYKLNYLHYYVKRCVDKSKILDIILLKGDDIMSTTNINVRIDENLKKDADQLFSDLGLNMSTAITMFLKSAISNNGIPFEIKRKEPHAETIAAIEDVLNGRNLVGPFNSVDKLMEDLNA